MNYNVQIDSNSIYEFSENITREGTKFIEILDKFLNEVDKVNECFDTRTGKVLKQRLIEVLQKDKEVINQKYISYSKTINNIAKIYDDVNEEIKKSVI